MKPQTHYTFFIFLEDFFLNISERPVVGMCRGTKCDCKLDWLWVRYPLEEMKYLLKFIFPFLRSDVEAKARLWLPPLNRQCPQNSAESEEWSVLTLGSLCLACCVRVCVFIKIMLSYRLFIALSLLPEPFSFGPAHFF